MISQIQVLPKRVYPIQFGVVIVGEQIEFSIEMEHADCGMILYTRDESIRVPFMSDCKIGQVYSGVIVGVQTQMLLGYNYYVQNKVFVDPYAKQVIGNEEFGRDYKEDTPKLRMGALVSSVYNWEQDRLPMIPYEQSIQYLIHVRGFTKDPSSKVKAKGTFAGMVEKLPYLLELGITSVELMPCYEFEEVDIQEDGSQITYAMMHYKEELHEKSLKRLNCWGYKNAHYFAPKSSYTSGSDCVLEMKDMVKAFHKAGIEVIMQFYFPRTSSYQLIYDVLAYWLVEFHIDGIHLMGDQMPIEFLAKEPLFADVKIMYHHIDIDCVGNEFSCGNVHLANYNSDFMNGARRFLKGDQDALYGFVESLRRHDTRIGNIQFISNYNEFTLYDQVSYDQKHNEDNGEHNEDGNRYNHSWNHGVEGGTRKRTILTLRKKQMKNMMTYLLLSQSTPMIMSGDEFGYSKNGNNNAYCHDNELLWINWKLMQKHEDLLEYTKKLISLRKKCPIFHPASPYKMVDTLGCGFPDLSYHGQDAWRPDFENYSRRIGLLYGGAYGKGLSGIEQPDYYIAYNAHWEPHTFALPRLKVGYEWVCFMNTAIGALDFDNILNQDQITVEERSVQIVMSRKKKNRR